MFAPFKHRLMEVLAPYGRGVSFDVSYPKEEFGHYATNIAFGLAKIKKEPTMKVAGELVSNLHKDKKAKKLFSEISVASPGFINFKLKQEIISESLRDIIYHIYSFGKNNIGNSKKINLEFVSANPTGPLTLGNGRSAAYGDALSKILDFSGFKVTKEYFINDIGNQVELLGESVARRFLQLYEQKVDFPEELYQGKYIIEIAKKIKKERIYHGPLDNFENLKEICKKYALDSLTTQIKEALLKFGLHFDVWFSENNLLKEIDLMLDELRQTDLLYEKDGALWFKATQFGLEKDAVLRKSIGDKATTYLASDFAYAKNKLQRGFDYSVYVLGADHHGDVQRIKAGIQAMGLDENKFRFLVYQFVTLKKGGKAVKMSKRKGDFITLEYLTKEVPIDVIKLFFLMKSLDNHVEFDLNLAKEESNKNPVYYIQYAHARVKSLIRNAKEKKIKWSKKPSLKTLKELKEKEAIEMIILINRFPEIVESVAKDYQVHRLVNYIYELASAIHLFYDKYRVVDEEKNTLDGRINLLIAAGEVLKQGLSLLGLTSPEKM